MDHIKRLKEIINIMEKVDLELNEIEKEIDKKLYGVNKLIELENQAIQ